MTTPSCKNSNYQVSKPLPYSVGSTGNKTISGMTNSSTSESPLPCLHSAAIEKGDDCFTFSKKNHVSTFSLLYENGLQAYCSHFPAEGKLCLPETCELYEVKKGDTCFNIVQTHNFKFSQTQLMSWNPNINRGCSNLEQLEKFWICTR